MAPIRSFVVYLAIGWSSFITSALGSFIYEGGTIIAFDEPTESIKILENASVLIEGNTITQLSSRSNLTSIPLNTTRIDATGKIISPGFIDVYV